MVESGEKRQTIRPERKRPTAPGDTLYLYTGMRTKLCRKLRQELCTSVDVIVIDITTIKVNGRYLPYSEINNIVWDDGFGDEIDDFFDFFEGNYGLPFEGRLIKW